MSPKSPQKATEPKPSSSLLPSAEIKRGTQARCDPLKVEATDSSEIERPRSALHAGDFTLDHAGTDQYAFASNHGSDFHSDIQRSGPLGISPNTPWFTPSSSLQNSVVNCDFHVQNSSHAIADRRPWRSRAPSLNSYSTSSFVLKPPTTPLVHHSNNTDLDFSPRDRSISPEKSSRRRTLPPHAFNNVPSTSHSTNASQGSRHPLSYRREASFPYNHQPRRCLTSNWSLQAPSSPQTPSCLRFRRTSFNSEASPLQHASMVGSYEESILRGWMSTAPSKPLDFTAQIGVLGKGDCKPKCPPHITVPFPAVYYNWNAGNGRKALSDEPSPYVGHIDLQRSIATAKPTETSISPGITGADARSNVDGDTPSHDVPAANSLNQKCKKRSRPTPTTTFSCGSYRIPQRGQLQIIIKNPNKTAVKLFLIPYDLEGMGPGTKTFVRQRSYSAEPIVDVHLKENSPASSPSTSRKPALRYLIHLNICCPNKGRFYLYNQIRVVFANRVPDNKEKLRNEIQVPQPRFNIYKPNAESLQGPSSSIGAKPTSEKSYRRESHGLGYAVGKIDDSWRTTGTFTSGSGFPIQSGIIPPTPAIPFKITGSMEKLPGLGSIDGLDPMELDISRPTTSDDVQSPLSDKSNCRAGMQLSSSYKSSSSQGSDDYSKLSKGDSAFGGYFGRPRTPEPGEGLLARRLKGLDVRRCGSCTRE